MPPVGSNDLSLQSEPNTAQSDAANSVGSIAIDVEEFAKTWVHRANRLVHRAARLVERESLLAGAIGRLNQQKEEWNRRTEAKDSELREQSELLTEAWLEVEAERRKAIQGARVAQNANNRPHAGPVVASQSQAGPIIAKPVQATAVGLAATHPVAPPPVIGDRQGDSGSAIPGSLPSVAAHSAAPTPDAEAVHSEAPHAQLPHAQLPHAQLPQPSTAQPIVNQPPAGMAPPMQPQIPINANSTNSGVANSPSFENRSNDPDALAAATKERLEEFKRMQRAIRANRNT